MVRNLALPARVGPLFWHGAVGFADGKLKKLIWQRQVLIIATYHKQGNQKAYGD
jgi:hypothetical protein